MGDVSVCTQQGIEAVRLGDPARGRGLLSQAVTQNPQDEMAWLWLSSVVDDNERQLDCLKRVLEINPYNHAARRDLAAMPVRFHGQVPGIPVFPAPTVGAQSAAQPAPQPLPPSAAALLGGAMAAPTVGAAPAFSAASGFPGTSGPLPVAPDLSMGIDPQGPTASSSTAKGFASLRRVSLGAAPYVVLALILLAMIGALLGTITTDLLRYRSRSRMPAMLPAATVVAATPSTVASATVAAKSAPVTIRNIWGQLTIPGSGYIDGRVAGANPPRTRSDVWIWDRPFATGQLRCKLPHGAPVQLLELATSPEGRHAIRIQHDDCTGWVDADLVNSVAVPAEGMTVDNDQWRLGK